MGFRFLLRYPVIRLACMRYRFYAHFLAPSYPVLRDTDSHYAITSYAPEVIGSILHVLQLSLSTLMGHIFSLSCPVLRAAESVQLLASYWPRVRFELGGARAKPERNVVLLRSLRIRQCHWDESRWWSWT